MSLEHFKKQVLLLHSERSTLDNLSAGFNDRYTVHCATSGTEALHTLGETQIDVIVSAQELPGMSGLDALREAKKRSPDTIGILLAGNEDDGLEALVGDQEVFQIVRGNVTPDSLKSLIDNATRQARLIALAESANDTTASPDEPVTEHIVMETSENGSAIISDGTASLPVLDPKKISAADVGSRGVDVLVLTQDEEFLATVQESARGMHNVIYANTLQQAEDAVRQQKVGVAVVDAAMVGSNVEKLTMHLRATSPRLVAIVAGRRDDGEMLMDLINRGKVYRFLLKPVSPGRSRLAIEASVKHHLEAPDSAFKIAGKTPPPPKIEPKPQPKAKPKPQPKPAPAAKAPAPAPKAPTPAPKAPAPAPKTPAPAAKAPAPAPKAPAPAPKAPAAAPAQQTAKLTPKAPTEQASAIVANPADALSPMDDGMIDAFGGDDSSFTETMTGIIKSVGDSISRQKKEPAETTATPAAAGSGGSLLDNPKLLGIAAAALVAIIGISFWMFSGSDEPIVEGEPVAETTAPSISDTESVSETEVVTPAPLSVDDLIDEARLAAAAGQVYNPPGSNAIELYLSALEVAPGDPVAEVGLQEVIGQALGMAETALLENRADDAAAALRRVELANPDNARLPFLNAQLAQTQLRDYLDNARLAIRESRFEDARAAISGARALSVAGTTEIDVVADELSAALSEQRVDEVLAQANARLEEGKLIAPSNDNARYYYELALSRDPANTAARQGLAVVASSLMLQARARIDAGEFDAAEVLLADARRLDPSSSEVAASITALTAARDRQAQQVAAAEKAAADRVASERAAAERAAAEKVAAERAAAEKVAAERAAAERVAAERAAAEEATAVRVAAERAAALQVVPDQAVPEQAAPQQSSAEQVAGVQSVPAAQAAQDQTSSAPVAQATNGNPNAAAGDTGGVDTEGMVAAATAPAGNDSVANGSGQLATAAQPVQQQAARPAQLSAPVSVSSLKRTKYVAPKYPRAAQRRNLSGWVDVVFTVDIDGTVKDVATRDSNPGTTFVSAATRAVEDWQFEPVIQDGVAVQKRAAVRMMFAIE